MQNRQFNNSIKNLARVVVLNLMLCSCSFINKEETKTSAYYVQPTSYYTYEANNYQPAEHRIFGKEMVKENMRMQYFYDYHAYIRSLNSDNRSDWYYNPSQF